MYSFERATQQKIFYLLSIFLLVFSLLFPAIPAQITHATDTSNENERADHGKINNEEGEIDYDRATINKQVDFGNKPGEYFIDLTVKGKDATQIDTTDIVIPYDLSNSMENNNVPGTNRTRTEVAAEATTDFINGLLGPDSNFRIAFVPYGTSIMDGETRSYLGNPGNYTFNQINPFNYYVGNFTSNANEITSKIPSSINHGNHGGTFTQQALERGGGIIATSNADNKIIVTITDGLPTISYNDRGQVWGTGTENQGNQNMQAHRTNTINEANRLKNDYTLYSIGVGLSANSPDETEVLEGIARTPDDAYFANTVQELVDALTEISRELSDSVVNGSIQDPITEEFILKEGQAFTEASNEDLTDGEYYVTASNSNLLYGVTVTTEGQQIKVDGLNLGKDEWINIRYKVQIDTDNLDLDPNKLYKTNGTTTLTPRGDNPDETNEFPEPEASTVPIEVAGEKIWVDFGYEEHRPDEIIVQLIREINGEERVVKEITVESDGTDVWEYKFDDVFLYDTNGDAIEYKVKEILPEGYDEHYESDSDGTNLTNVLKNNANIELIKTGVSTSGYGDDVIEVGKEINYTFTITNTGNLPLKNITLEDELEGISSFTYETLNGDPFTDDIEDLVMQPNDVLVATATYEVKQEDFNRGQVDNHAEVEGTPTVPEPNTEFDDTPVTDEDNENVPGELKPEISLVKTANKEFVTEAGEIVTYTFEVTNTGNTTLTDVTLNDPMLGGEITLDETTLQPGESTTVKVDYEVTQADIHAGEILNEADVEGTPPPAYTENPDNPDKVTDEDDEKVIGEQNKGLMLEKEADKQKVERAGETITYTLTVTNTGNVTLYNVTVNDEMLGGDLEVTPSTLKPGEQGTVTGTYEVTQEDIDRKNETKNIATATGTPPGGDPNDPDNPKTPPVEENVPVVNDPEISLVKQADKEELVEGETVTYTFTATNVGNVTLENVNLTDELEGISEIDYLTVNNEPITDPDNITLKPGDVLVATATYEVTQEDIDKSILYNHATVEGTPPAKENPEDPDNPIEQDPVTDDDDEKVPSEHKPEITLDKSTSKEEVTQAGDIITYKFVVTNTGNVTLDNVKVNDPMLDELGIEIELEKDRLVPGESTVGYADYTVTQDDIDNKDKIENIATAIGTPPGGDPEDPDNPQSPPSKEEVPVEKNPEITIEKTAVEEVVVKAGDKIHYNFVVTNTGNVTLEDVKVNDPMLEAAGVDIVLDTTTLKPGESTVGQAVYTVTQEDIDNGIIKNVATSTGTPPGHDPEDPENPVSPLDEVEVPAKQEPNISLEKLSNIKTVTKAGQKVTYTFVVTNTGNTTLENLLLDDPMLGGNITLPQTTLAPGEKLTVKQTYYVTEKDLNNGEITNIAKVTGQTPGEDPATVEDEDTETIKTEKTGETLPKTATNHYTLLAIGFAFLLAGLSIIYFRRRNQA